ncbi:MAG: T9SS type A sorting domain-containing protein [Ignavibacteriaceae bacterium]
MKNSVLLFTLLLILIGLNTTNAQAVADPASLPVYVTTTPITMDGQLLETAWAYNAPHLMFKKDGTPSGQSNTPTSGVIVKGNYRDISTCYVKLLRSGMKLYISLNSDDQQVCRFGDSWEGDGLFMKIKNAAGNDVEYKLYFNLGGVNPDMHYEGPSHSVGVGYKKPGTTVGDSTNTDAGYSGELMIDLDSLGYTPATTVIPINFTIFEPDHFNDGQTPWGIGGDFYKQWWGSEWGNDRSITLTNTNVPVELTGFSASVDVNGVNLSWSTATESNNRGFEIQRSSNKSVFQTIAFVNGVGSTSEQSDYSYIDKSVTSGNYNYRLKQIDFNGAFSYSKVVEVLVDQPANFELAQNFPNPFNPSTNVSFSVPVKSDITVEVYNLVGELVSTLAQGTFESGSHQVTFNASNLTSGIYLCTIKAVGVDGQNFVSTNKMTLLK